MFLAPVLQGLRLAACACFVPSVGAACCAQLWRNLCWHIWGCSCTLTWTGRQVRSSTNLPGWSKATLPLAAACCRSVCGCTQHKANAKDNQKTTLRLTFYPTSSKSLLQRRLLVSISFPFTKNKKLKQLAREEEKSCSESCWQADRPAVADALSSHGQSLGSISPTVDLDHHVRQEKRNRTTRGYRTAMSAVHNRASAIVLAAVATERLFPCKDWVGLQQNLQGSGHNLKRFSEEGPVSCCSARRPAKQRLGRPQLCAKRADPVRQLISLRSCIALQRCRDHCLLVSSTTFCTPTLSPDSLHRYATGMQLEVVRPRALYVSLA